jgi:hypothetical protein
MVLNLENINEQQYFDFMTPRFHEIIDTDSHECSRLIPVNLICIQKADTTLCYASCPRKKIGKWVLNGGFQK